MNNTLWHLFYTPLTCLPSIIINFRSSSKLSENFPSLMIHKFHPCHSTEIGLCQSSSKSQSARIPCSVREFWPVTHTASNMLLQHLFAPGRKVRRKPWSGSEGWNFCRRISYDCSTRRKCRCAAPGKPCTVTCHFRPVWFAADDDDDDVVRHCKACLHLLAHDPIMQFWPTTGAQPHNSSEMFLTTIVLYCNNCMSWLRLGNSIK